MIVIYFLNCLRFSRSSSHASFLCRFRLFLSIFTRVLPPSVRQHRRFTACISQHLPRRSRAFLRSVSVYFVVNLLSLRRALKVSIQLFSISTLTSSERSTMFHWCLVPSVTLGRVTLPYARLALVTLFKTFRRCVHGRVQLRCTLSGFGPVQKFATVQAVRGSLR